MDVIFDFGIIGRLLENFYKITGIRYSLADANNNILKCSNDFTPFCKYITSNDEGYIKCKKCDFKALKCVQENNLSYYTYRCHLGLVETIIPICHNGENIGYVFLGQHLSEGNIDKQWEFTKYELSKWIKSPEKLEFFFYSLPTLSDDMRSASIEILIACTYYVFAEGLIKNVSLTDFQRINIHIEENYDKKISLASIANSLAISKTKLCNIALKQDTTINEMIRSRRLKQAKSLLVNTHYTITEISQRIGIEDYNYFSKLFKANCGMSPRKYRKDFQQKNID